MFLQTRIHPFVKFDLLAYNEPSAAELAGVHKEVLFVLSCDEAEALVVDPTLHIALAFKKEMLERRILKKLCTSFGA